jgi:microcystin-dependent protein
VKYEFEGTKIVPKSLKVSKLKAANFKKTLNFERIKHIYREAEFKKKFTLSTRTSFLKSNTRKRAYPLNTITIISSSTLASSSFDANGVGLREFEGWFVCNGLNGTPDLRGRFLVGEKATNSSNEAEFKRVGQVGGRTRVKLSKREMPSHTHKEMSNGHSHEISAKTDVQGEHSHGYTDHSVNINTNAGKWIRGGGDIGSYMMHDGRSTHSAGSHAHDVKGRTQNATANLEMEGGDGDFEILPPYFVVHYIIYLG